MLLIGRTYRLFLYAVLSITSGDKDDCNKTIEVMKRAEAAPKNPSSTRFNASASRIHQSPLTPDETQLNEDHEGEIDECESEKDGSGDNDDESLLLLANNESLPFADTESPSPVLPIAPTDVSPLTTPGLMNNTLGPLNLCFVC